MIILEASPFKLTLALLAFLNTPLCERQSNWGAENLPVGSRQEVRDKEEQKCGKETGSNRKIGSQGKKLEQGRRDEFNG